jgi:hypothetical protein
MYQTSYEGNNELPTLPIGKLDRRALKQRPAKIVHDGPEFH